MPREKRKFVVRRIPPDVTERQILNELDEFEDDFDWFKFYSTSRLTEQTDLKSNRVNWHRFYISFKSNELAMPFIKKFQGMAFEMKGKGMIKCQGEFAPSQTIGKRKSALTDDSKYIGLIYKGISIHSNSN